MGKQKPHRPLPGQLTLTQTFDRVSRLSTSQIEISANIMQDARVPLAEKLKKFGWKDRMPKTGNPEHFQLRHPLQPETYLELGDAYATLGRLAPAAVSGVDGCLVLRPVGLYPLDAILCNASGLWLNPLTRARTPEGLLGWFRPGSGVTLLVSDPKSGKPARVGEYYGTRPDDGGVCLLLHCEQDDGSIRKFKIKLTAGIRIRVCLVSGSGQILV